MAETVNIIPLNPNNFEFQEYSSEDNSLITSLEVENSFDSQKDKIEYFIYDLNGNILYENVTGYTGYRLLDNVLTLYPDIDLISQGYTEGQFNTLYNFVSPKLESNPNFTYFLSQISSDRTEVRLDTTNIPDALVIASSLELTNEIANSTGSYYDFYLDFGSNQLVIANNILLDTSSINNPTVLVKLYEPLPEQFTVNSQLWVVTQLANPVAYNINLTQTFEVTDDNIYLKGPNTSLSIKNEINNSTEYSNLSQLNTTSSPQGSGSFQYQLNSMLADTGIEINVDYSNYANFIHFGSAYTQLENFYYKLSLIEQYNYSASLSSGTTANYYVSSSNVIWQNKINEIITGFSNYEYFLYYDSGSACWPKTGNTPPYTNVSTTSLTGQTFLTNQSQVAAEYDAENSNFLVNAIPSYLTQDPANAQYELFIEMIGQHFDTIFLYTQDITNKYNANNSLTSGVSKDLVADILRDMGVKIYQNNFSSNDLYSALLGFTPSGSLYNLPYTTGSLPTPTGYEYINTYITASATGSLIPTEDINAEIYKRIYANLPYLLKKKGTVEGLRALVTLYGIPDTILQVNEFGGQNKIIENDYDLWFNQYNFAYYTSGSSFISSSFSLNSSWNATSNRPSAVEFRFRTDGLPQNTASIASQSLWETDTFVKLVLKYTGSGYTSGSYSGSIVNPYNQYAKLDLIPDYTSPQTSASIYLPFYNGEWWSVLVNKVGSVYTLYAKDKNYEGEDGNTIGFQASSSVDPFTEDPWNNAIKYYFGISSSLAGKYFTGSFQEIRYYVNALDSSSFNDYVMNPYSIDANGVNTAPTDLAFRASLGGELYTSSISIHPKVTGSWITTSSFASNSNFYIRPGGTYIPNTEIFYLNQFPAGIKNRVSNKIRQQGEILPYSGSNETNLPTNQVLSPFISIQQSVAVSGSYTPNIDYVEVAFSPQNQINNDIAGQLGYFNIGEYIGDPRLVPTKEESYPALDAIRDYYFEKYTSNYNIWDYIRLIKYFDNSLFKMIADWTPARTDLASGIVIKQTTLERNKYPVPQPNITSSIAWVGSGSTNIPYQTENILITGSSIQMYIITGSSGGSIVDTETLIYSSSPISLINPSATSSLINIGETGAINIQANIYSSGTNTTFKIYDGQDIITGTVLYENNTTSTTEYTINETFNVTSGYVLLYKSSVSIPDPVVISNLNIYQAPSYYQTVETVYGLNQVLIPNEFDFNGELQGSEILVTDGDLNPNNPYKHPSTQVILFDVNTVVNGYNYQTTADNITLYSYADSPPIASIIYLTIPNQSKNGVDITSALDNLTVGSRIKFTAVGDIVGGITYNFNFQIKSIKNIIGGVLIEILNTFSYNRTTQGDPIATNSETILSPFLNEPNFYNSDFNPIINNAIIDRVDPEFYDVDFSTNAITAVNRVNIISASRGQGVATPAAVQASNYTTARIINPRYVGSKNTSPDFNIITNQQLPSVEKYTSYFIYTPGGLGNTLAERSGSGNYKIGFLVDELGNITQPTANNTSSAYIPNLIDAFGADTPVILSPNNNQTIDQAEYTVYKPAVVSNIIMYSDTGSLGTTYLVSGSYPSIFFSIDPNIKFSYDFTTTRFLTPQIIPSATSVTASWNFTTQDDAGGWNGSIQSYQPPITTNIRNSISASLDIAVVGTGEVTMSIMNGTSSITTSSVSVASPGYLILKSSITQYFNTSDSYWIKVINNTNNNVEINSGVDTTFKIRSDTATIQANSPYWYTGSSGDLILSSSADIGKAYQYFSQIPITGSGFDNPQPLNILPYDEIRFNGNEAKVATIVSSSFDDSNLDVPVLYLYLQAPFDFTSVNIDYFAIRRWVPSVDNIIINTPGTIMGSGFIFPKYPSPLLRANLPSIIENLTNKGLV